MSQAFITITVPVPEPGQSPGHAAQLPAGQQPGRPNQGLPGGQGGHASQLPTGEAWVLVFSPTSGYRFSTVSELLGGGHADQGLPGQGHVSGQPVPGGGHPNQGLPGQGHVSGQPLPGGGHPSGQPVPPPQAGTKPGSPGAPSTQPLPGGGRPSGQPVPPQAGARPGQQPVQPAPAPQQQAGRPGQPVRR